MSAGEKATVAVIGAGRVGTAIGAILSSIGYRVVSVYDTKRGAMERAAVLADSRPSGSPGDAAREADIVLITTSDDAIEEACISVADSGIDVGGKVFVHMSGALGLEALRAAAGRGAKAVSIHPLQTFADVDGAMRTLPGSTFGVTCLPEMDEWAMSFVEDLGGRAMMVREADKTLYHAAAVVACNLLTMVEGAALQIYYRLGLGRVQALSASIPLIRATVDNIERLGPAAALTGPLARGDVSTIRAHLEALASEPELERLYRAVSLWGLNLVIERGELDHGTVEEMRRLLQ
jgi:predicted short-subunit dehydrogenase-like oxidoreductase (DUF2520 family)